MTDDTVRAGDSPAVCPYCDRPLPSIEILALHVGRTHGSRLTESEQDRFDAAKTAEADELRRLQLKAVAGLVVLYFGLLFAYSIFA